MMMSNRVRYCLQIFGLFAIYFIVAKISKTVGQTEHVANLIWPPAGIALATLLLYGYRLWPGVFLGGLMLEFSEHASLIAMFSVSTGITLEALGGAYLLKKAKFNIHLDRTFDVMCFIIFGAVFSTMISAIIGVGGLHFSGELSKENLLNTINTWWVGDMLGVLVTAPLLLVWNKKSIAGAFKNKSVRSYVKPAFIFIGLAVTSFIAFGNFLPYGAGAYKFLVTPFLAIIVIYYGQRGNVMAIALLSFTATVVTVMRYPEDHEMNILLFIVQQFIVILSISFMFVAAALAERDHEQRLLIKRAVELDKKSAYLKKLNDAKDEFISLASHQLRTPATVTKMYLGMALLDSSSFKKDQRVNISTAYNANERLIELIGDLLTVAEVQIGELILQKQKTDIKKLIEGVIITLHPVIKAYQQKIVFNYERKDYIQGVDRKQMRIAIENLIENASKYSYPQATVYVDLAKRGEKVIITIRDEGVGIRKKDIRRLFNKFSRIPNELTSERSGNGLGLYLVKEIVESHGGRITVQSELGVGTTFTVSI